MNKIEEGLPKDIFNLFTSYLSEDEINYNSGEWHKFKKDRLCTIAAQNEWLDLLKWAHSKNLEQNSDTCIGAAEYVDIEILKYLHENNCPWARSNGCDWNIQTCLTAVEYNNEEIIGWLNENNCPCEGEYH